MSPSPRSEHDNRWLILVVIAIAQLMVVLDATIVNIALPSAQRDLGFGNDSRQWVVTAYAAAFGSLLLLGGRLGDLFGRKWTFIGGLIGFGAASILGGIAGSFGLLVAARVLQGVFGAVLAPSALGLLSITFSEPSERAKAFGVFGAVAGGGAAVGLLLGGILTETLSWRWCLYVNILIALPTALAAFRLLVNHPHPERPKLDLPGTAAAVVGVFALIYGFSNSETHSWGHPLTIISLVVSAVALTTFVLIERRTAHPLLPLRVVLDRARGGAYLAIGIAGVAAFAVFLFLTYFLQQNLGFSPIQSGLAFLPMPVTIVATSTTVNIKLLQKVGAKPLMTFGMVMGSLVMIWFAQIDSSSTYAGHILPGLIGMGLGFGSIFAPAFATATYGVEPQDTGVASAMVNTMQQVGGSVGTALLSSIFAGSVSGFAAGRPRTAQTLAEASIHGYETAFYVAGGIFIFGAVVVATVMRSVRVGEPSRAAEPVPA
jgi:EmrB/QacA subfamily drug resistance transporter